MPSVRVVVLAVTLLSAVPAAAGATPITFSTLMQSSTGNANTYVRAIGQDEGATNLLRSIVPVDSMAWQLVGEAQSMLMLPLFVGVTPGVNDNALSVRLLVLEQEGGLFASDVRCETGACHTPSTLKFESAQDDGEP